GQANARPKRETITQFEAAAESGLSSTAKDQPEPPAINAIRDPGAEPAPGRWRGRQRRAWRSSAPCGRRGSGGRRRATAQGPAPREDAPRARDRPAAAGRKGRAASSALRRAAGGQPPPQRASGLARAVAWARRPVQQPARAARPRPQAPIGVASPALQGTPAMQQPAQPAERPAPAARRQGGSE